MYVPTHRKLQPNCICDLLSVLFNFFFFTCLWNAEPVGVESGLLSAYLEGEYGEYPVGGARNGNTGITIGVAGVTWIWGLLPTPVVILQQKKLHLIMCLI